MRRTVYIFLCGVLGSFLLSSSAYAVEVDSTQLAQCTKEKKDSVRLACFDALAKTAHATPDRPTFEQVKNDAERITKQTELMLGVPIFTSMQQGSLVFEKIEIKGMSPAGALTHVKAVVYVRMHAPTLQQPALIKLRERVTCQFDKAKGFYGWFIDSKCWHNRKHSLAVTFVYRKYDTGWQLESY